MLEQRFSRTLLLAGWLIVALALSVGCSRTRYRLAADRQVTQVVNQKSNDPRWAMNNFTLGMDPRSRFFDPYNPDREPMPPDDPYSHVFMHRVDGMRGYPFWHRNGNVNDLQNPGWRERLGWYLPTTPSGAIKLNLEDTIRLAYIHSPDYRTQLETVYLSALDVTTERFRFSTQFYGGYGPTFAHIGRDRSGTGTEQNTLTLNTAQTNPASGAAPTGLNTNPAFAPSRWQFQKTFSTGGQLLAGFANSFVWQFAGDNTYAATSLLNFSFVQPLLRAGGRAVVLEQLTITERNLLANLRSMQRYRQGFYTNMAVGDLSGVTGPSRVGGFSGGTGLTGFTGQGAGGLGGVGQATNFGRAGFGAPTNVGAGVAGGTGFAGGFAGSIGGFVGLLQQLQQIRNTEYSLDLQLRTLALLEANLEAGVIDITQVDLFRQNIETERANLLASQISLANSLDTFKRQLLGLPPDLEIELDDSMIAPFQLIDPTVREVEEQVADFIAAVGRTENPTPEVLGPFFDQMVQLRPRVATALDRIEADLKQLEAAVPGRQKLMTPKELPKLRQEQERLAEALMQLRERFATSEPELEQLRAGMTPENGIRTANALVAYAGTLNTMTQEASLVEARARLESVVIEPINLDSKKALEIARAYRLDWANNRATVVNTWRLITFNANALKSNLTITLNGDLGTVGDKPFNFAGRNADLIAGLRFDPPFTRLLERNNYRQSLISYQQDRRSLIQFEDGINQTLRQDVRLLTQLRMNLEIQRRAVAIAVRRVDKTLEDLNQPPAPVQVGQTAAAQFGPTAALNLLTAISDLRNAQNNFLSVWFNYYSERMQLYRDLGVMEVDAAGMWIDRPLEVYMSGPCGQPPAIDEEIPPPVPQEWLREAGIMGDVIPSAIPEPDVMLPQELATGGSDLLPGPGDRQSSGRPIIERVEYRSEERVPAEKR